MLVIDVLEAKCFAAPAPVVAGHNGLVRADVLADCSRMMRELMRRADHHGLAADLDATKDAYATTEALFEALGIHMVWAVGEILPDGVAEKRRVRYFAARQEGAAVEAMEIGNRTELSLLCARA